MVRPALVAFSFGITLAASVAACSGDLFHSTDWVSECQVDPATAGCGGATSSSSSKASSSSSAHTSSSSSASSSSSSGSSSTGGGAGGADGGGVCGDGVIDVGEECDDANVVAGDGCDNCKVECSGNGVVEDPKTHHCYMYVAALATWNASRKNCQAWHGDLAAIKSAAELAVIEPIIVTNSWIGATDAAKEGTWVWVTGEPFVYTNWASGEPGGGVLENCLVQFSAGKTFHWNDVDCTMSRASICERAPAGK